VSDTTDLCTRLAHTLCARGWMMATAESCTGGLIAAACTALPGSSQWFERGLVSYANSAKVALLGVPEPLLAQHGAVSEAVARAMAQGACNPGQVQVSLAVTGIAGPSGGSPGKPVGTVWFAWCIQGAVSSECRRLPGDRSAVRQATVLHALQGLLHRL